MVTAALLAAAAPAAAQLQVGENHGVRIVRERGALVVIFTPRAEKLWRRVAGRVVSVYCVELPDEDAFGITTESGGGGTFRAPKRGRRLVTGDRTRRMDICRVWLEPRRVRRNSERRRLRRVRIVTIPMTQRGSVLLDERAGARDLFVLLSVAPFVGDESEPDRYPTPAELFSDLPEPALRGKPLVALTSASDTPPAGSIGYYSDGAKHAAAVVLSAAGRRLFLEYDDDVVHTNVLRYLPR